jgi:hypothetical protein
VGVHLTDWPGLGNGPAMAKGDDRDRIPGENPRMHR